MSFSHLKSLFPFKASHLIDFLQFCNITYSKYWSENDQIHNPSHTQEHRIIQGVYARSGNVDHHGIVSTTPHMLLCQTSSVKVVAIHIQKRRQIHGCLPLWNRHNYLVSQSRRLMLFKFQYLLYIKNYCACFSILS